MSAELDSALSVIASYVKVSVLNLLHYSLYYRENIKTDLYDQYGNSPLGTVFAC